MPENYVQVPANSTGVKVAGWEEVVATNTVQSQYAKLHEAATFFAVYDRIVPAANKYMATLFNTSATRRVRVWRVWSFNWQIAAVTGVLHEHEFKYITARTSGTAITPVAADSADTLSAGITADHASTVVTESTLLKRFFGSSEEAKVGAATLESSINGSNSNALVYDALGKELKPITLRQNRGITCKMITSTAVGTGSFVFEFTDEPI